MKCAVEFCDEDPGGNDLCLPHENEFQGAPEWGRYWHWLANGNYRGRAAIALADWVRRISAEHRNGGLGAPLSDERAAAGGSGGSGRENATTAQAGALPKSGPMVGGGR